MTRDETIARARLAAEVLDNPLVAETLAKMHSDIVEKWRCTPPTAVVERETLHQLDQAIGMFEEIFRALIAEGQYEEGVAAQDARRDRPVGLDN